MSSLHLITHTVTQTVTQTVTMAANEGIFDWITGEFSDAGKALAAFVSLAATAFFAYKAVMSRFALSAVVMAAICMLVFIVIFKNTDLFADKVEVEVNSAPAHATVIDSVPQLTGVTVDAQPRL
jgi:hypothetical protein